MSAKISRCRFFPIKSNKPTALSSPNGCAEKPGGCTLVIIPENGGPARTIVTSEVDLVEVNLMAGSYKAVLHNWSSHEWESLSFRDLQDPARAAAYSNFYRVDWLGADAQMEPSRMSSCVSEVFEVTDEQVDAWRELVSTKSYSSAYEMPVSKLDVVARLVPRDRVATVKVKAYIRGIDNLYSVRCVLDGLRGGQLLSGSHDNVADNVLAVVDEHWTRTLSEYDVTLGSVEGEIRILGLPDGPWDEASLRTRVPELNRLRLQFLLRDGKTVVDTLALAGHLFHTKSGLEAARDKRDYDQAHPDIWPMAAGMPPEDSDPELDLELELVLVIGGDENGLEPLPGRWDPAIPLPHVPPKDGDHGNGFDAEVADWEDHVSIDIPL